MLFCLFHRGTGRNTELAGKVENSSLYLMAPLPWRRVFYSYLEERRERAEGHLVEFKRVLVRRDGRTDGRTTECRSLAGGAPLLIT